MIKNASANDDARPKSDVARNVVVLQRKVPVELRQHFVPFATMPSDAAQPRVPGANVRAFLKREDELRLGREHCRKNDEVRVVAQFEEKGLRKTSDSRRARDAKLADEELGHMNYELKIRRRARLNDLYNALGEQ